jgi:dCTP deaminase
MDECNPTEEIKIPDTGFVLIPGELYIGATNETASSKKYVPMFDGRSSIGRLGIALHQTAGIGDVGFSYDEDGCCTFATWTLELSVIKPVRIYPNRRVGQVFFIAPDHVPELSELYHGKYSYQKLPQASLSWKDR